MKASFWHSVWERNSLGFHQKSIHPFLESHLKPRLTQPHQRVFVPLCGKSDDMVWLAEHMEVVGAELSEIACQDFFSDRGIKPRVTSHPYFELYSYENIHLWHGDFFKLIPQQLGKFDWIYDRAALIALPIEMQKQYVEHLSSFIGYDTSLFLVSLEYPPKELTGPPFAITTPDIERLFSGFNVDCVAERELDDKIFAQRRFDVSFLKEKLYLISSK